MRLLRPGSVPWLTAHELRLSLRGLEYRWWLLALLVVWLLFIHGLAWGLAEGLARVELPMDTALAALGGMALTVAGLKLTLGLVSVINILYDRGDLDLLLSSPIRPSRVVPAKALAVAGILFGGSAAFILPFANVFTLTLDPRWLLAYVVLPCLALLTTSVAMLVALGLIRWLGVRRARLAGQVTAGVMGMVFVLLPQVPNALSKAEKTAVYTNAAEALTTLPPAAAAPMQAVGRALTGEPLPFLIFALLSLGLFYLVAVRRAGRFVSAVAQAAGTPASVGTRTRRAGPVRFRTHSPKAALRQKEWRLVRRDPALITQIVQQLVFLAPIALPLLNAGSSAGGVPVAFATTVTIAGMLAATLAWVAMAAEDAPEMLAAAPVPRPLVVRAKLEASMAPVLAILLVASLGIAVADPVFGAAVLACGVAAGLSGAMLNLWYGKPAKRKDIMRRNKGSMLVGFAEVLLILGWTGVAVVAGKFGWWALLPAVVLVGVLAVLHKEPAAQPA